MGRRGPRVFLSMGNSLNRVIDLVTQLLQMLECIVTISFEYHP